MLEYSYEREPFLIVSQRSQVQVNSFVESEGKKLKVIGFHSLTPNSSEEKVCVAVDEDEEAFYTPNGRVVVKPNRDLGTFDVYDMKGNLIDEKYRMEESVGISELLGYDGERLLIRGKERAADLYFISSNEGEQRFHEVFQDELLQVQDYKVLDTSGSYVVLLQDPDAQEPVQRALPGSIYEREMGRPSIYRLKFVNAKKEKAVIFKFYMDTELPQPKFAYASTDGDTVTCVWYQVDYRTDEIVFLSSQFPYRDIDNVQKIKKTRKIVQKELPFGTYRRGRKQTTKRLERMEQYETVEAYQKTYESFNKERFPKYAKAFKVDFLHVGVLDVPREEITVIPLKNFFKDNDNEVLLKTGSSKYFYDTTVFRAMTIIDFNDLSFRQASTKVRTKSPVKALLWEPQNSRVVRGLIGSERISFNPKFSPERVAIRKRAAEKRLATIERKQEERLRKMLKKDYKPDYTLADEDENVQYSENAKYLEDKMKEAGWSPQMYQDIMLELSGEYSAENVQKDDLFEAFLEYVVRLYNMEKDITLLHLRYLYKGDENESLKRKAPTRMLL